MSEISEIQSLLKRRPQLLGFNVTIPYKTEIIQYLDNIDDNAKSIGAVNTVKIVDGELIGFNTDYYGFEQSLRNWLPDTNFKALILGTGGASNAVVAVLENLGIEHRLVSTSKLEHLSYKDLSTEEGIIANHKLIINTTPLGMIPKIETYADLPYHSITSSHYLYDLVYNPEETLFLSKGKLNGATTKNGIEMLHLQAEKAWEIWSL